MAEKTKTPAQAGEPMNQRFAATQQLTTQIGTVLVALAYVLYIFDLVAPMIPVEQVVANFGQPINDFLAATQLPSGWDWLAWLEFSDMQTMLGLLILSSVTVMAYISILPILIKEKNWPYLGLVVVQMGVFVVAAMVGGH